jgi:hypothetical protein
MQNLREKESMLLGKMLNLSNVGELPNSGYCSPSVVQFGASCSHAPHTPSQTHTPHTHPSHPSHTHHTHTTHTHHTHTHPSPDSQQRGLQRPVEGAHIRPGLQRHHLAPAEHRRAEAEGSDLAYAGEHTYTPIP